MRSVTAVPLAVVTAGAAGLAWSLVEAGSYTLRHARLPVLLWRDVVAGIASEFHLEVRYLVAGWSPWALMALGLVCLLIGAVLDWRNRDRRFYGPTGAAWAGWGVSLYVLGFALATQVAQIADSLGRG